MKRSICESTFHAIMVGKLVGKLVGNLSPLNFRTYKLRGVCFGSLSSAPLTVLNQEISFNLYFLKIGQD